MSIKKEREEFSQEIQYIKKHCNEKAISQIARELQVDVYYVRYVIERFNLDRGHYSPWTDEEDAALHDLYKESSWDELCEAFPGRTKKAIQTRANLLNLTRNREDGWTEEDHKRLRELYPYADWRRLKKAFPGRSIQAIAHQARLIGVKRLVNKKREVRHAS